MDSVDPRVLGPWFADEAPRTKRPKWSVNPNACDVCRKRKSKCRVTSSTGACERCLENVQRCSLQVTDADDSGDLLGESPATAAGSDQANRERGQTDLRGLTIDNRRILVRLDARTKDLEKVLRHVEHLSQQLSQRLAPGAAMLASREFYGEKEDGIGDDDDMEESVAALGQEVLGTSLLYVTGMNLHDHTSFVDPVGMGLVTTTGMDSLIERFHDCMDNIYPLRELFDTVLDPKHPFLRSCILPYLSFTREGGDNDLSGHQNAQAILDDNLARLHASNPSTSIMGGLAILSLSPTNGFEKRYVRKVDGGCHIQNAMDMALAHGLDDAPMAAQRQTMTDLSSETWLQPLRIRTLLWYVLAHRASWVSILSSPSMSARPYRSPPLTAVFTHCKNATPLLKHLFHEARLLSLLETVTTVFRRVRQSVAHDPTQLRTLWASETEFRNAAARWRMEVLSVKMPSGPFLAYNSLLLDILICFKFSTDCVTRAPSPLGPTERLNYLRDSLLQFRSSAVECIDYAVSAKLDLAVLPAFHLTLAFMPFRALRAASLIDPVGSGAMAATDNFMKYRSMLVTSHPLGAQMVQNIEAHRPTDSWQSFVSQLPDSEIKAGETDVDAFAERLWAMCEEDNLFDFTDFAMQ